MRGQRCFSDKAKEAPVTLRTCPFGAETFFHPVYPTHVFVHCKGLKDNKHRSGVYSDYSSGFLVEDSESQLQETTAVE